jgi:NADH-quinone oxidoreductase subunit L
LLTAVYMFRVVFLAFHGPSPGHPALEHPALEHPALEHPAPGHPAQHPAPQHPAPGTHLHDAPPAMAFALIVLAIGSVGAGWFGTSFEHFLEPSFSAPAGQALAVEPAEDHAALESTLMAVSTIVAAAGIGLAVFFFLKRREAAARAAERFPGLHRVLENKYYVDEIYDAAVVQPIHIVSAEGLWKTLDVRLIDGAVNGVGAAVQGGSEGLRRLQTGSVRAYAASLLLGAVMVLGYYLWR